LRSLVDLKYIFSLLPGKGPQSKKAISIIKQLPTMPKKILLLESVLYVLNKFNFRTKKALVG
jgi:hypothetical protein